MVIGLLAHAGFLMAIILLKLVKKRQNSMGTLFWGSLQNNEKAALSGEKAA